MDLSEFTETFFEEADELLLDMERNLLEMDLENLDTELLNAVFRAAHSIKGGAGTFGFTMLQETTHILENLLDDARKGEFQLTRPIVDTFLEAKDMLSDQLEAYKEGAAPDQAEFEHLCSILQAIGGAEAEEKPSSTDAETPVATQSVELFVEQEEIPDDEPEGERPLVITFLNVNEKDRDVLIEEMGHLGTITDGGGNEQKYDIDFITDTSINSLQAVLCFVINEDQLKISLKPESDKENSVVAEDQCIEEAPAGNAESEQKNEAAVAEQSEPEIDEAKNAEAGLQAPVEKPEANAAKSATVKKESSKAAKSKSGSTESSSIRVAVDKVDQVINLVGELIITQSMLNETINSLDEVNHTDLLNGINQLQRNARDLQNAVMSIRMLPMDYVFSRFPRLVRDMAGKLGKEIDLNTEGESTELDKGLTERIIDPLTHLVRNSLDHGIELPEIREAAGKSRRGTLSLSAQHQGGNILIEVSDDGGGLNREKILAKAASSGIQVSENISDDEVWQLIFAPGFSTADEVSDLSGRGVGMDVVKRNIQAMGGHVEIFSRQGEGTTTRIVLPLTLAILDGMLVKVQEEIFILPVSSIMESLQLRSENLSRLPGDIPMLKVREEYYPMISVAEAMGMKGENSKTWVEERKTAVMVNVGSQKYVMLVDGLLGQQQVVVKNIESNYRKIEGVAAATILGDGSVALILDIGDVYRLGQKVLNSGSKKRLGRPLPAVPANVDREISVTH